VILCPKCGKPKAIDAFSGEGGAGEGYMRAGFCCDAVDNSQARLDRYPVRCSGQRLILADALEYLVAHGHEYAFRHTSPPCTGYSRGTAALPDRLEKYDRMIAATRDVLQSIPGPYVIENVEDAHKIHHELIDPLTLCGFEFNLTARDDDGVLLYLKRHRVFESNVFLMGAGGCSGHARKTQVAGVYGGARRDKVEAREVRGGGYVPKNVDVLRSLLGTPWMTEKGCMLSIPPAYTEHLGTQILETIGVAA
jgi:DNA (cytosine-5)-methyltransferase 1